MDAKGRIGETEIRLEVREHLVEDGVLVVEVGHVGDDEVEIDVLFAGTRSFRPDVADDLGQAA